MASKRAPGPSKFAFPFYGAGEASYFEWAHVDVRFEREPSAEEKDAIVERIPPPLRASVVWKGLDLSVGSDQTAHVAIAETYQADPGDPDPNEELDEGSRFFFAKNSQVQRFNAEIEDWLRFAHDRAPIRAAFRGEDSESGGTKLSAWHKASLRLLSEVLPHFEDLISAGEADSAVAMLRGILEMASDAKPKPVIPERLRAWLNAGEALTDAVESHDADTLRRLLSGSLPSDALESLANADLDDVESRAALWSVADLLLVRADLPAELLVKLTSAAACVVPDAEKDAVVGDLCRRALAQDQGDELANEAYHLAVSGEFLGSMALFDHLVEVPDLALSTYCNALWAAQADNNHLPVDPKRARRYLAACLPAGPENPAIFFNAACCFMELGESERVFECFQAALTHGFDNPTAMRDERLFAPLAETARFKEIFANVGGRPAKRPRRG